MPDVNYTPPVPSPLNPDALHAAIQKAVAAAPLIPANKRFILVGGVEMAGSVPEANAVIAVRAGDHWQFAGHAHYQPDHDFTAGAQVIASF